MSEQEPTNKEKTMREEVYLELKRMNRECLKDIAREYAKSGIVDKSSIGYILTKVHYGMMNAESNFLQYGTFDSPKQPS